jgi:hypothetical protein
MTSTAPRRTARRWLIALLASVMIGAGGVVIGAAPAFAFNALPCDPNGPQASDGSLASQLNPQLNGKMAGHLNAYNMSCARVVVQTVRRQGLSARAAEIAITTIITESSMADLDGGDGSSVGLYQQISSWGSFAQRTDPVWATNKFLSEMLRLVPDWQTRPIGEVCQAVQRSAYPDRYQAQAHDGVIIADALWGSASVPTGRVFMNLRAADTHWVGASLVDGNPTVTDVAMAATPNGEVHMFTLGGGKVYTNVRRTDGSWTGAFLADGGGYITDIAAVATANGEVHMFTLSLGNVYTNVRRTDGSWTGAFLVDGNRTIGDIAAAALPNGEVLLLTVGSNKVFANLRATNGAWSGAFLADGNGYITDIAAAVTPNGEVHMFTVSLGSVYTNVRRTDSSWTGAFLADGNNSIAHVAATGTPNGEVLLITLGSGKVFNNLRATNGSWSGAFPVDSSGRIINMAAAGSPINGEVHMATIAP